MGVIMTMTMVVMAEAGHTNQVHCQTERADNEKLQEPFRFSAFSKSVRGFNENLNTDKPIDCQFLLALDIELSLTSETRHFRIPTSSQSFRNRMEIFHSAATCWLPQQINRVPGQGNRKTYEYCHSKDPANP
jgi:hypothetical protein